MAYNPYDAVKSIYDLKGLYDEADKTGDATKKNSYAQQAQSFYQELKNNGYGDLADRLSASNQAQAKVIKQAYETMGKTATRPYMYTLGESYGLTQNDIDGLIKYDDITGEVSFGGKNLGKPDADVDGVSYWNDTGVLDRAFSDYAKNSGLTKTSQKLVGEHNQQIQGKINDLFKTQTSDRKMMTDKYTNLEDYNYNHNPYDTEIGKAIMEDYKWQGKQASDNAVADGSSTNGGNIDSFSAANANRQQMAFTNAGKQAVLADFNTRVNNARGILSDMGVYLQNQDTGMQTTIGLQQNESQRLFENDETAKNNAVSRDSVISKDTGYNTIEQLKATSSLWNSDGSLVDRNTDYQAEINRVEAQYRTATDAKTKEALYNQLKLLEMARNQKISETKSGATPTYKYQGLSENATMRTDNADRESAERLATGKLEAEERMNTAQLSAAVQTAQYENEGDPIDVITIPNLDYVNTNIDTTDNAEFLKMKGFGVDKHGVVLLGKIYEEVNNEPYNGYVTNEELLRIAVRNSDDADTNKNQITCVFRYLHADETLLPKIENRTDQWEDGVVFKEGYKG